MQHLLQTCRVFLSSLSSSVATAFVNNEDVRGAIMAKLLPENAAELSRLNSREDLVVTTIKNNSRSSAEIQAATSQPVPVCNVEADEGQKQQSHLKQQLKQLPQPGTRKKQWISDAFITSDLDRPTCIYCGAQIIAKNTSTRKKHLLNPRVCK